jgi:hypothetical protein
MKWAAPHYGLLHVRQAESRPILLVIRQKCQARTRSAPARTLLHPAAAREVPAVFRMRWPLMQREAAQLHEAMRQIVE